MHTRTTPLFRKGLIAGMTVALFFASALLAGAAGQQQTEDTPSDSNSAPAGEAPAGDSPADQSQASDQSQAAEQSQANGAYPLLMTDDLGNEVALAEQPTAIISLSLFSDEVLLDMLPGERFEAVTNLAANPIYSNVAAEAAEVEPKIEFTVERIISLFPDLVVAADWSEGDKLEQLRRAGIAVYQVATPASLDELREAITDLGMLVGEPQAAADIIAAMDAQIADIRAVTAEIPEGERVRAMDYTSWNAAAGSGTTWDIVLGIAGIDNAAAELETDDFGQASLSKEVLIDLDPEVLFLPGYIWGEDDGAEAFAQSVRNDPALAGVDAIRSDRVYLFPERLKGTYSHYLAEAAAEAARLTYPERFPEGR